MIIPQFYPSNPNRTKAVYISHTISLQQDSLAINKEKDFFIMQEMGPAVRDLMGSIHESSKIVLFSSHSFDMLVIIKERKEYESERWEDQKWAVTTHAKPRTEKHTE